MLVCNMISYRAKTPFWMKFFFPQGLVWEMPQTAEPTVYITFDDGPHPFATQFALDQLKKHNAKATFFCVGENVTKYPDVFEQVLNNGHVTANHTFNHLNGWKTENNIYLENIDKAAGYIKSNLFRPPYGKIKWAQAKLIRRKHPDNKIIMWSILSCDFDKKFSGQQCIENVIKNIKPGSIVIFHDSEKAWDRMSFALPKVLDYCQKQGWEMKSIPN